MRNINRMNFEIHNEVRRLYNLYPKTNKITIDFTDNNGDNHNYTLTPEYWYSLQWEIVIFGNNVANSIHEIIKSNNE